MRRAVAAAGLLAAALAGLAAAAVARRQHHDAGERRPCCARASASVGASGEISGGAEGEYVSVTGKECGIPGAFFRALGGGTTLAGGR